ALVGAGPLEVAGLHFERVVATVAVGIEPFADGVALIAWLLVFGELAAVGIDAAWHERLEMDVGDGGPSPPNHPESPRHDPLPLVTDASSVGVVALAAARLVPDARLQDGLEFQREWCLLASS